TLIEPAHVGRTAPVRVLMLPAAYAGPADFLQHGFVRAVRDRSLEVDLVFAGFELQEVSDGSLFRRLREEILLPADALGCTVWMGGISLGGYLALGYAERYPRELAGLCLFAPYLGSHLVTSEIERANGLGNWQAGEFPEEDEERRGWGLICTLPRGALPLPPRLGREGRFPRGRLPHAPRPGPRGPIPPPPRPAGRRPGPGQGGCRAGRT